MKSVSHLSQATTAETLTQASGSGGGSGKSPVVSTSSTVYTGATTLVSDSSLKETTASASSVTSVSADLFQVILQITVEGNRLYNPTFTAKGTTITGWTLSSLPRLEEETDESTEAAASTRAMSRALASQDSLSFTDEIPLITDEMLEQLPSSGDEEEEEDVLPSLSLYEPLGVNLMYISRGQLLQGNHYVSRPNVYRTYELTAKDDSTSDSSTSGDTDAATEGDASATLPDDSLIDETESEENTDALTAPVTRVTTHSCPMKLTLRCIVVQAGTLTIGFNNLPDEDEEDADASTTSVSALSVHTKTLSASDTIQQYQVSEVWDYEGDFLLSFTGKLYIVSLTLKEDLPTDFHDVEFPSYVAQTTLNLQSLFSAVQALSARIAQLEGTTEGGTTEGGTTE
jgi:hypothetical protein